MAVIAINEINEDVKKFFERKAIENKKKFVVLKSGSPFLNNTNSYIIMENPHFDRMMLRELCKSRPRENVVIYRVSNIFELDPTFAMVTDYRCIYNETPKSIDTFSTIESGKLCLLQKSFFNKEDAKAYEERLKKKRIKTKTTKKKKKTEV